MGAPAKTPAKRKSPARKASGAKKATGATKAGTAKAKKAGADKTSPRVKKPAARKRGASNGHAPKTAKHPRSRARKPRNLDGLRPPDPLARDLIAALTSSSAAPIGDGATAEEIKVSKAQARKVAVEFGGAMLEATNVETAKHSDDVVVLARAIAEQLGIKGTEKQDLLAAARLHDIGKAAVPIAVIEKPGPLNDEEWELMRQHTLIGDQILGSVTELAGIARMVRHSHERWDGNGYPDGLAGEDIPLGSRVIFCADAFHAIRSDRPYRAGRTAASSMAEVKRSAGTQFDPAVVDAFFKVAKDLKLAPSSATAFRRSSRLTALLLMLAIGTTGSAVAASGILGEPTFGSDAAPARTAAGGQLLGISFDDAIQVSRNPASRSTVLFGPGAGAGAAVVRETGDRPSKSGSPIGAPVDGSSRPGASGSGEDQGFGGASEPSPSGGPGGSGESGESGESGTSGTSGNSGNSGDQGSSGNSGSGHPHGGPPGRTGNHPNGGNSGSGNSGSSGSSGSNGNGPGGSGPPGQSKANSGSSGTSGTSSTSGTSGSSGPSGGSGSSGSSGSVGSGPGGSGPPGQAKKPK